MTQLKRITWGILLLATVFVACKKKGKNEGEGVPKTHLHGEYLLKQIKVAGQPLPEKLAVSQYLTPMLQNLSDEKKKIGVYVMSEIAKGFDNHMKRYPNDIDDTATLVPDNPATTNQLYDIIYNKLADSNSIFDEFYNFIPLLIPEDLLNFILGVALESSDNYIDYAQAGDILSGTDITKDGLYIVNAKENSVKFLDPQIAFRDSFLSMLTRMLFDHNIVKLIHQHIQPLILADGVQPQADQMNTIIQTLASIENELFTHPAFKIVNDAFALLDSKVYNSVSLQFSNNESLEINVVGQPVYDVPAHLTFYPNSTELFNAVFLKTSAAPSLMLDFKNVKQENNILHLGLKDVNGAMSLINVLGSMRSSSQKGVISSATSFYNKIMKFWADTNAFALQAAQKNEHLLLQMLLEKESYIGVYNIISGFSSLSPNKEPNNSNNNNNNSLIVLELEKYN